MNLAHVIVGPVVTEKAERLKAQEGKHVYTLWVAPTATKIEIKKALNRHYDVTAATVRVMKTQPKTRQLGAGVVMEKRHAGRKVMVTLAKDSKALDLTSFRSS